MWASVADASTSVKCVVVSVEQQARGRCPDNGGTSLLRGSPGSGWAVRAQQAL